MNDLSNTITTAIITLISLFASIVILDLLITKIKGAISTNESKKVETNHKLADNIIALVCFLIAIITIIAIAISKNII